MSQGGGSDFAGKLRAQKPNKAETKGVNIPVVQYFLGIWSYAVINSSGVNLVVSFILSLLHFLKICAKLPFFLHHRHRHITPPPWFGRE